MDPDFELLVESALKRARVLYVREFPFKGLRPDFLIDSRDRPIVLEVKENISDEKGAARAVEVATKLRQALEASAALVVVPDGSDLPDLKGIVRLSRLQDTLYSLGAHRSYPAPVDSREGTSAPFLVDRFVGSLKDASALWMKSLSSEQLRPSWLSGYSLAGRSDQLFIAMPFASEFDDVYFVAARSAAAQRNLVAIRIDQKYFSGEIPERIRRELKRSVAVIADVSGGNPNVLYEVGFAHALRKPTVHISRTPFSDLPFDVSKWNTLPYQAGQTHALAGKLDTALRAIGF